MRAEHAGPLAERKRLGAGRSQVKFEIGPNLVAAIIVSIGFIAIAIILWSLLS